MIKIDADKNIAYIEVSNTPTHTDIIEAVEELFNHPDHVDGMNELWDFTNASMESFDREELKK